MRLIDAELFCEQICDVIDWLIQQYKDRKYLDGETSEYLLLKIMEVAERQPTIYAASASEEDKQ